MDTLNSQVYHKNVLEFIAVANEYVLLVKQAERLSKQKFLDRMHKFLPFLYLKMSVLPRFENLSDELLEKFVSEDEWISVKNIISQKLGEDDVFFDIQNVETLDFQQLENISLSECFADIYQDLKDTTSLYSIGNEDVMNDAMWDCQQNFERFWGPRLIKALENIHNIYFGNLSNEEV